MGSFFKRDTTLGIAALLIALLIWFLIKVNGEYSHSFDFSLVLKNIPPDFVLASNPPELVVATVKGVGRNLIRLGLSKRIVVVDCSDFTYGERRYTFSPEDFLLPYGGLEVETIDGPKDFILFVDRLQTKRLPVKSAVEAFPADGYLIQDKFEFVPDRVVVSGPRSIVRKLKFVETLPETLSGLSSTVSFAIGLKKVGERVSITPDKVIARVDVKRGLEKRISDIPLHIRTDKALDVEPDTGYVSAVFWGVKERIEELTLDDVGAFAEITRAIADSMDSVPVVVVGPKGVRCLGTSPEYIHFKKR